MKPTPQALLEGAQHADYFRKLSMRPKKIVTLRERLLKFAEEKRRLAQSLPQGRERAIMIEKARQIEEAANTEKQFQPLTPKKPS
jgi:hypothetical protein